MSITKATEKQNVSVGKNLGKLEVRALLVGTPNGAAAMDNSMELPDIIKNETTIKSSNSMFGIQKNRKQRFEQIGTLKDFEPYDITPSRTSQSQKDKCHAIPAVGGAQHRQMYGDRGRDGGCQGLQGERAGELGH